MVGLVIVSHSRALAEAAAVLAQGVTEESIPVAFSGGTGEDLKELGTDATDIMEAIQRVDSPDGTVLLMDLGSAILSAETALEFLEGTLAGEVRLVPASLVEGAVSAAVQIALHADLDTVVSEALDSLGPKREQLGYEGEYRTRESSRGGSDTSASPADQDSWKTGRFRVDTAHGLHARPAARLVQLVGRHQAKAEIRHPGRDSPWVNARSLNRVTTLQVLSGEEFEIRFSGVDAGEAVRAVASLVEHNFGEPRVSEDAAALETSVASEDAAVSEEPRPASSRKHDGSDDDTDNESSPDIADSPGVLTGVPAAGGLAIAPIAVLGMPRPDFARLPDGPFSGEERSRAPDQQESAHLNRLEAHLEAVAQELRAEADTARRKGRQDEADIAEAHALLLLDPDLIRATRELYEQRDIAPEEAFWHAAERVSSEYREMDSSYMRARAIDVIDVALRLIARAAPTAVPQPRLPDKPSVLVAEDLLPSVTMHLDGERIRAIVTTSGSASSHAAIIARGIGIPMVAAVPLPAGWESDHLGKEVVVDGDSGVVELAPDDRRRRDVRRTLRRREEELSLRREAARRPAGMAGGETVAVLANVATIADARRAADNGADGVGLLRTEFLFLDRSTLPDEDTQLEMLREMTAPFHSKPITVRLLDIGGDKNVPALNLPREENPFLGVRGVRLLLAPDFEPVLRTHLRALFRLAAERVIRIMIPMVSLVEEIRLVRKHMMNVQEMLVRDGVGHAAPESVGIMVETPAAALMADRFARICDFFSLGTNDLTQYIMACERGNSAVGALEDGLHPAVLKAIRTSVDGARRADIPISICGELGSDSDALPILLGLGIRQVSVNAAAIVAVKEQIRELEIETCRRRAGTALTMDAAQGVRTGARTPE